MKGIEDLRKSISGVVGKSAEDELIEDVEAIIGFSKESGPKLGKKLSAMRAALKKAKKWYSVINGISELTGFNDRTILRWVDGKIESDKMSDDKAKVKAEFNQDKEVKSLVGRLINKQCSFMDASRLFLGRMLDASGVQCDEAGDEKFIAEMTSLVQALAEDRGLDVSVQIMPRTSELKEAA